MKKKQFTLIEMLVVIAIIAVLATMVGSAVFTMMDKGNSTACIGNLNNLGKALLSYKEAYKSYPYDKNKTDTKSGKNHHEYMIMLRRYKAGTDPRMYICPSADIGTVAEEKAMKDIKDSDFTTQNNTYAYFMGKSTSGQGMAMSNSSGILADGFRSSVGGTTMDDTENAGWNHEGAGNFTRVDGSNMQATGTSWPDQVKGNDAAIGVWNTFALD